MNLRIRASEEILSALNLKYGKPDELDVPDYRFAECLWELTRCNTRLHRCFAEFSTNDWWRRYKRWYSEQEKQHDSNSGQEQPF